MYNLHPVFTTLPFALFMVVAFLEGVSLFWKPPFLQRTIQVNLLLAGLTIIPAFLSGYQGLTLAEQSFTVQESLIVTHHSFGKALLFIAVPCVALGLVSANVKEYRIVWKGFYYLTLFCCVGLVIYTGYLGAELVFSHGAGVKVEAAQLLTREYQAPLPLP